MTYVNQVAEVVHGATHRQGGAANKNIGDAFLLVWKFPQTKHVAAARRVRALDAARGCAAHTRVRREMKYCFCVTNINPAGRHPRPPLPPPPLPRPPHTGGRRSAFRPERKPTAALTAGSRSTGPM